MLLSSHALLSKLNFSLILSFLIYKIDLPVLTLKVTIKAKSNNILKQIHLVPIIS